MQVKVGEVDKAMDGVMGSLDTVQQDLEPLEHIKGDPKYLETHMRKLQVCVR